MPLEPKVTLLTWTQFPLETIYSIWQASKTDDPLMTPMDIIRRGDLATDHPHYISKEEVERIFWAVISQKISVVQNLDFVFMLENVTVSFREQMVRHRIGVKPSAERVGVDIVMADFPDLADSSFWAQSMRIKSMADFAEKGQYRMAESIENGPTWVKDHYVDHMVATADLYSQMIEAGIPMEDARDLIPLGAQHRVSWKLNLDALTHVCSKRSCFIAQLGLWGPIIKGMVNELATKVHPIFRELVTPPCIKKNEFKGCLFHEENRRRISGEDDVPVCSLYHTHETEDKSQVPIDDKLVAMAQDYGDFWGRDPYTGKIKR